MASFTKTKISAALFVVFFCASTLAGAIPPLVSPVTKSQVINTLSTLQIAAFQPYTHYASTAYCLPASTLAWNCGPNCEANPSFIPVASGGDGDTTQLWFVGYDPTLQEVIVSHQGTNPEELLPILIDGDVSMEHLKGNLFPGIKSGVKAHGGFTDEQSRSGPGVFAAVQTALSRYGATKLTVTGHSLGAAIALLDALSLHLRIPQINTRYVGYGAPRVGNQAFANFVDSSQLSVMHINNKKDIVPIVPMMFLGYHHPSGEIHIQNNGAWLACPGQDNDNKKCAVGDVPNIFESHPDDHMGPFDRVMMGC